MSFAAEGNSRSELQLPQRRSRSKGQHCMMKHLSNERTSSMQNESNHGVSAQLSQDSAEKELTDQVENEGKEPSLNLQDILAGFLATKLQVIERENQTHNISHHSSSTRCSKRSFDFSDVVADSEFKNHNNTENFQSNSQNPESLDFWKYSERSCISDRACDRTCDRTCLKNLHKDHRRNHQSHRKVHRNKDEKISPVTVHSGFKSLALQHRNSFEKLYGSGAFPFTNVSLEHVQFSDKELDSCRVNGEKSQHGFSLKISHECLSDFQNDNQLESVSENSAYKSKRKHGSLKKPKKANEFRHKKSKKCIRKDSVEVSTLTSHNFSKSSRNELATSQCYKDSSYDDVKIIDSEIDREDFGYSREKLGGSTPKSCDSFQQCIGLLKTDSQVFNIRKQSADFQRNDNDLNDETWLERYDRTKKFKKSKSHNESFPVEVDTESLQDNEYSQEKTIDPFCDCSSEYYRPDCAGSIYTNVTDKCRKLNYSRTKTHSRTKSPISSSKKKSVRKAKHSNKHEKKQKDQEKSPRKSSSKHKSTKRNHRKNKSADKILSQSSENVENAESNVLPSDDDDNFRPMLIRAENNDDVTELLLRKSGSSKDGASGQCCRQRLDYNSVVACAESNSVPSRIVKTYKEGVAVSRLLRRVKTRIGPLKPVEISRLQATLPRLPVMTVDKFSQRRSAIADQMQNSVVVQDVEDPGVEKPKQPQTSDILPTISDFAKEHTSGDISQAGLDGYTGLVTDTSDPKDRDRLFDHTDALQETVALNVLSEFSHTPKQDVRANVSVDPLLTVKMAAGNVGSCLRLSFETPVTCTSSTEVNGSETFASNSPQVKTTSEVAPEVLVGACAESDDGLPSCMLLENSRIQNSSELVKHVRTDEVEDTRTSNCCILPKLESGSCCSDGVCPKVRSEEGTSVISPDKDSSLEGIAVVAADVSVTHGTTFAETATHQTDPCQEAEVNRNRLNEKQCSTLLVPEISGVGAGMTRKGASTNEGSEIEVIGKEMTGKEVNERRNEVSDVSMMEKEWSRSDVNKDVECHHYTQKGLHSENEKIQNKTSNSQGSTGVELEVEHTKEVIICSGQSLEAGQENCKQALKVSSLNKNVIAPCSDIPCDSEQLYESVKHQESQEDRKTVKEAAKKSVRRMGIKISGWSAAFISSGTLYENDPKKQNREEGELTDSSAKSSESEDSELAAPVEHVLDLESSGNLSESAEEEELRPPVVRHKSKKRKKHKQKYKKNKRHKRHHSKESSSDEERSRSRSCSRSRSRSFSVARTFDEEKGVWRDKKHKYKRKKVCEKKRPRLNIDKEKLREIAIKNSLHNQLSFKRPTMRLSTSAGTQPGGKSVAELTDFCKTISGQMDYSTSSSEDDNSLDVRQRVSDGPEDDSEMFMSNFMKGRDKDARIVLNIRDSRPLPALNAQQMIAKKAVTHLMYPVSSGAQHRRKEEGWLPVMKPDQENPLLKPHVHTTNLPFQTVTIPAVPPTSAGVAAVELATARAPASDYPLPLLPPNANSDLNITERLAAIRRLNANPRNEKTMEDDARAQMQMQQWAEDKQMPGQFFSSVVQMGLMGHKLKKHDWLQRSKPNAQPGLVLPDAAACQNDPPGGNGATDFHSAFNPQDAKGPDGTYNIGKLMMLRMGWRECEGLGRQNLGNPTPLLLDVKRDRKGLQAPEEKIRPLAQIHSVKGKHPVSALMEICEKRRIGHPEFVLVDETGPSHLKCFLYKIILNGTEYQPNVGSNNKKAARLQAAVCCLNALGFGEENK